MSRRDKGSWPADFDPTAHPIIAHHWFGIEPLYPISQIMTRAIADVAHTVVANTNSPQN